MGGGVHVLMHSQIASWHTYCVLSESVSLYVQRRISRSKSLLAISSLTLHKSLSTNRPNLLCGGTTKPLQPPLCQPLWRDIFALLKEDGGNTVTEGSQPIVTATKAEEQLRGRIIDRPAGSQSIMPAALPLHYGDTMHTHRPAGVYHKHRHTRVSQG